MIVYELFLAFLSNFSKEFDHYLSGNGYDAL